MKKLPDILTLLGAAAIALGLLSRVVQSAQGVTWWPFLDPIFYWRGATALLLLAIAGVLIQIRDK